MPELELTRPWLLLALLLVPVVLWYFWHTLVDLTRTQRIVSLCCRIAILVLLALALAGLTLLTPTDRMFVIFLTDTSQSIDDAAREKAREFLNQAEKGRGGNEAEYMAFALEPDEMTSKPGEPAAAETESADEKSQGTNIAAALQTAFASIPPFHVPSVVLLTDGNETHGDAVQAILQASIPVSTVPLPVRDEAEVQVSAIHVPAQVRQGEPFYVEVVIDSNRKGKGTIEIFKGDLKLDVGASAAQEIKAGENRFRFRQTVDHEKLAEFSVRIAGFEDTLLDNNIASGLVYASGKPRVLLIDSEESRTRNFVWSLEEQDIAVDVRPPQGTPTTLAGLQNYEAVLLSNVPATDLSLRQMETLRTYVQDLGGGLIMLGGDQSFGLGGYYKTTLEEILPVRSNFEKEKEQPSLAMTIVVDKSGSMGGMKMELAKEAAISAVELLGPRDQIGVIAFDGASYWVSEVHSAADKQFVIDRIRTIQASGGTNIYPAMEDAYRGLNSATAKLKHVILLTDGHSSPGDFEGITTDMASARMTVSTVAVGSGSDQQLLETIADDPQAIPQIFAKETVTASKSAINEMPFLPQVVRPTQVLREIDLESAPFLLGYVATRPKPTSEFILASENGEPLLVWWRYGLGMTAAYTSDIKNRWAAEWASWPEFGKFWAQVIRHVMRKSDAEGVFVEVDRHGAQTAIAVDAVDPLGRFINDAQTRVTVLKPNLEREEQSMAQTAPGRYTQQISTAAPGTYHLEISQHAGEQLTFRQTRGLVVGYPDELRMRPVNTELLERIAQTSGGKFDPKPAEVFDPGERTARLAEPLWPYLLMAAVALLVIDVALRRIDFSLLLGRR